MYIAGGTNMNAWYMESVNINIRAISIKSDIFLTVDFISTAFVNNSTHKTDNRTPKAATSAIIPKTT
ncbi:hypothetical protein GCM10011508_06130 [Flavobacterium lutivivi]|nr:hypothetical protein GCM10011508_06130 [Flavobacterium lutivivi]